MTFMLANQVDTLLFSAISLDFLAECTKADPFFVSCFGFFSLTSSPALSSVCQNAVVFRSQMGLVRRDWTWNKTDLGSHLPTSSFGKQLQFIYLVPGTVVSTQRFALSLFLTFSFYRPSDLIHS